MAFFTLLKTNTSVEAHNLIMGVQRDNGYEAWRSLALRFEPEVDTRRMREFSELNQLQNKRSKNAAETTLIDMEVDRRRIMIIEEIGGQAPGNDTLVGVLWMAMG